MRRQLRPALVAILVFTTLVGLVYPVVVTGIAQVAFGERADGSPLRVEGEVVGSSLLAQPFDGPRWFQPRPSAIDHDATTSWGRNLGPTNPELLGAVAAATDAYRLANRLPTGTAVPIDAVTASASGLDPHISPRNARLQAPRVADERGLPVDVVLALVDDHTEGRTLRVLGEPRVNVVTLNAALTTLSG
jgi:K+-transporting ATPase ATPase C chain